MKNINLLISLILACLLISFVPNSFSQNDTIKKKDSKAIGYGIIKGKVIDDSTKEGIPFASVVIEIKGKQYAGTTSDMDGRYTIKNIPSGMCNLKATYVGYYPFKLININIIKDSIMIQDIELKSSVKLDVVEKPAIYLYPKTTQEIKVKLNFKGKILNTYPEYNQGWTVRATPEGKLFNPADKRNYNYLFWDGTYKFPREHYNYKSGFIVNRNDLVNFLQTKLSHLGLNETEINDFIVYWLPQLNRNETNMIHFWLNDNIDNTAFLDIEPKPDTEIRVFMEFRKADNKETIPEQKLPKLERKGFTVVEWGGSEIGNNKIE